MNSNQLANIVTSLLQLGFGYFVARGTLTHQDAEAGVAAVAAVILWILSHVWHAGPANPPGQPPLPGFKAALVLCAGMLACLTSGCVHVLNQPQGKILSVSERGIGLEIDQSQASQTPQIKFGFFSSAVVILPTQTNGPVYSPGFANSFSFDQAGALNLGIGEDIASGNYATYEPGKTNAAPLTAPVVPK